MKVDVSALTRAHVALVHVEEELRREGRRETADGLAIADLVVLHMRLFLTKNGRDAQHLEE
jgi:hypothetical protein